MVPGVGEPGQSGTRLPGYAGDRPVVGDLRNGVPRCSHVSVPSPPSPRRLLALGTAIGTVAVAGPAAANTGGAPAIPLNTEQETTGSDTGASGFFSYTIQGSQLCYTLEVRGLSLPAVAAHIHKAPRHVAGPIVIPFPAVPSATTVEASACVTPAAASFGRPPGEPEGVLRQRPHGDLPRRRGPRPDEVTALRLGLVRAVTFTPPEGEKSPP